MVGHTVPQEKVQVSFGCLAAGMNPLAAAKAAGGSHRFAYELDRKVSGGVSRYLARTQVAWGSMPCRAQSRPWTGGVQKPAGGG